MKKKVPDILDILEPATIKVNVYETYLKPFLDELWIIDSDLTVQEISKLLPNQLQFIYSMKHEHPQLLPNRNGIPGRIQELVYLDIMEKLKNRSRRDYSLERKVTQLWIKCGGHASSSAKKEKRNG